MDNISLVWMSLLTIAACTRFIRFTINHKKWNLEIVDSIVIKRNIGHIIYNVTFWVIIIVLTVFNLRNNRGYVHFFYRDIIFLVLFTIVILLELYYEFLKPRITTYGLFYCGMLYRWKKIGCITFDKEKVYIKVNAMFRKFDARILVKEDPALIKQKIADYVEELKKNEVAHIV